MPRVARIRCTCEQQERGRICGSHGTGRIEGEIESIADQGYLAVTKGGLARVAIGKVPCLGCVGGRFLLMMRQFRVTPMGSWRAAGQKHAPGGSVAFHHRGIL